MILMSSVLLAFVQADYDAHVAKLEERIASVAPEQIFHVVVQEPFIVIGDESEAAVRGHARGIVKWAIDRLKGAYFSKDPNKILEVWLFKDAKSYERHAKLFFGDDPGTPFGYYAPHHGALIMNIETGGGTLVHEIVHPFIESNFPECPPWFNEGLGSLYEQSSSRDDQIVGLTNWRLAGLQGAIRADSVPTFKTLMGSTQTEFYNKDAGTKYAQSRYLLYYLQEKGLLHDYYEKFTGNLKDDPSGHATLFEVLGRQDVDVFQAEWEEYVLGLRFPNR